MIQKEPYKEAQQERISCRNRCCLARIRCFHRFDKLLDQRATHRFILFDSGNQFRRDLPNVTVLKGLKLRMEKVGQQGWTMPDGSSENADVRSGMTDTP